MVWSKRPLLPYKRSTSPLYFFSFSSFPTSPSRIETKRHTAIVPGQDEQHQYQVREGRRRDDKR